MGAAGPPARGVHRGPSIPRAPRRRGPTDPRRLVRTGGGARQALVGSIAERRHGERRLCQGRRVGHVPAADDEFHRGPDAHADAGPAWRGRPGAPHRLRQHRGPHARPHRQPDQRGGRARGPRREQLAADSEYLRRGPRSRRVRWDAGARPRLPRHAAAPRRRARAGGGRPRGQDRSSRAAVHRDDDDCSRPAVQPGTCVAGMADGACRIPEGGRALGRLGTRAVPAACHARGWRDRAGPGAAGRRGASAAQLRAPAGGRSRLRSARARDDQPVATRGPVQGA